jgi:hypothetical protein
MKLAVCLYCGAKKPSAVVPCVRCERRPTSPEDVAKSLLLTDRHRSHDTLLEDSARLERGEAVEFPAEELASNIAKLKNQPALLESLEGASLPRPIMSQKSMWQTLSIGLAVALLLLIGVRVFG